MLKVVANTEEVVTGTTNDFATRWGVTYAQAAGFIAILKLQGVAKDAGEIRKAAKGKPSSLYAIPTSLSFALTGS